MLFNFATSGVSTLVLTLLYSAILPPPGYRHLYSHCYALQFCHFRSIDISTHIAILCNFATSAISTLVLTLLCSAILPLPEYRHKYSHCYALQFCHFRNIDISTHIAMLCNFATSGISTLVLTLLFSAICHFRDIYISTYIAMVFNFATSGISTLVFGSCTLVFGTSMLFSAGRIHTVQFMCVVRTFHHEMWSKEVRDNLPVTFSIFR